MTYYGQPPHPKWPNQAYIAVQFVFNNDEGDENHVEYGDVSSEYFCLIFLSKTIGISRCNPKYMSMDTEV